MDISFIPKFLIRRVSKDDTQQIHWNVLLSSIILLLVIPILSMEWVDSVPHFCIVKETTGIPCPGCGVTRSLSSLGSMEIYKSLSFNPNGILIAFVFLLQVPLRIIALVRKEYSSVIISLSKWLNVGVILSLFIYWCLQIIKH